LGIEDWGLGIGPKGLGNLAQALAWGRVFLRVRSEGPPERLV